MVWGWAIQIYPSLEIYLKSKGPKSKASPFFNATGSSAPRTPLEKMQLIHLTRWEDGKITLSLAVNFLSCLFKIVSL